jgi:uncharacterized protein YoxC
VDCQMANTIGWIVVALGFISIVCQILSVVEEVWGAVHSGSRTCHGIPKEVRGGIPWMSLSGMSRLLQPYT